MMIRHLLTVLLFCLVILLATSQTVYGRAQDNFPPQWQAQLDSLARPFLDPHTTGLLNEPLVFKRDAVVFSLDSGRITFFAPVRGRVTGALFRGSASLTINPPHPLERQQMLRFTGDTVFRRSFAELYLRFTDSTFDELLPRIRVSMDKKINAGDRPPGKYARHIADELSYAMGSRLLLDLHNGLSDGLFYAAFDPPGDTRYHFLIDPRDDEAVRLYRRPAAPGSYLLDRVCSWSRAEDVQRAGGDPSDVNNNLITSLHYDLSTRIFAPSRTDITARLDFIPLPHVSNLRAVRFRLATDLTIDSILSGLGEVFYHYHNPELARNYNARYPAAGSGSGWGKLDVFWPAALPPDTRSSISFTYHGKYLLYQFPWGDFYINETTTWYPTHDWRTRTTYQMDFDFSATREIIAVGEKVSDTLVGDRRRSSWRMDYPVAYVSFNYGDFAQLAMPAVEGIPLVEVYRGKNHTGDLFSKDMKKKVGDDIIGALKLFTAVYGALPFDRLAASEIPGGHGQGFPQLLHLSWSSFQQEFEGTTELFRAHEVAHQWWGHLIGWKTYHDQWLSEGFAEFSGAWFVEEKYGPGKEFLNIIKAWREAILERGGRRNWHEGPQVAPIWMGIRCSSDDSPGSYRALIYNKGAYVLHMLRMMLRDYRQGSDQHFIELMRDFVRRFRDRSASTEDFQQVVATHLGGGGKMNWFFDQWVYGTEIPKLKYKKQISKTDDGQFIVKGRIEQSEVSSPFRMFMPITLDFGNDRRSTFLQEINDWVTEFTSPPLPLKPKKVIFNDYLTILCRD